MLARSLAGAVLLLSLGMALVSPATARAEPEVNLAPGLTVDVSGSSGFSVAGCLPASTMTARKELRSASNGTGFTIQGASLNSHGVSRDRM